MIWEERAAAGETLAEWGKITTVTFAAGRFWAMSRALNFVATSADGVTWLKNQSASSLNVGRIAEGDGVLLGIDTSTSRLSSPDGEGWNFQTPRAVRSTDGGQTWNYAGSLNPLAVVSGGLIYQDGEWWAGGTALLSSPDGIREEFVRRVMISRDNGATWEFRAEDGSPWSGNAPLYDLEGFRGKVYVLGIEGTLVTSLGQQPFFESEWSDPSGLQLIDLQAGGDTRVGVGRYGLLTWSRDGTHWQTASQSTVTGDLGAAAWGNDHWIVAGNAGLARSSDGKQWQMLPGTQEFSAGAIAYGGGKFVAGGPGSRAVFSDDVGDSWNEIDPNVGTLRRVVFGRDRFVGLITPPGGRETVHVSSDGLAWAPANQTEAWAWQRVEYIEGLFYAVGSRRDDETGVIARSAEGLNWTVVGTTPDPVFAIAGRPGRMVAGTQNGWVWVSTFGAEWSSVGSPMLLPHGPPASFEAVGSQFVGVTYFGRVVVSFDGTVWEAEDFSGVGMIRELEQGNGQLLAVGNGGVIWESGTARFTNNSARSHVGQADSLLISGFVVNGSDRQRILLRAAGPALRELGVPGALNRPVLQLLSNAGTVLGYNAGWSNHETAGEVAVATGQVGAFTFPEGSNDSAMLFDLPAGAYTAAVSGMDGETGVALVEIYAISATGNRLVNISTRTEVGTGNDILVMGFVVSGEAPSGFW